MCKFLGEFTGNFLTNNEVIGLDFLLAEGTFVKVSFFQLLALDFDSAFVADCTLTAVESGENPVCTATTHFTLVLKVLQQVGWVAARVHICVQRVEVSLRFQHYFDLNIAQLARFC